MLCYSHIYMASFEKQQFLVGSPTAEQTANAEKTFEFQDTKSLEEYLAWKKLVPTQIRRLVERKLKGHTITPEPTGLPMTDKFLAAFAEQLSSPQTALPSSSIVENLIDPLFRVETLEGYLNVFETMTNPETSWRLRVHLYETQIKNGLDWLIERDLQNINKTIPNTPPDGSPSEEHSDEKNSSAGADDDVPPSSEDLRSSMEAGGGEEQEGEPTPLFSVRHFLGGYFPQLAFSHFDVISGQFQKPEHIFQSAVNEPAALDSLTTRLKFGKIRGGEPLALPVPADWDCDPASLEINAPHGATHLVRNQSGRWYLQVSAPGVFVYRLRIARRTFPEAQTRMERAECLGTLPDEVLNKIMELKAQSMPRLKLKRELVKFIRQHLTYSQSREAWQHYENGKTDRFKRIWERREADCMVSNLLAFRALQEIDKDVEYVAGFYVKDKNKVGDAIMHKGNGHAWLYTWDAISQKRARLDATPKGDPTLDQEEQERELEGELGEGDYADQEDEILSEQEAKEELQNRQRQKARENESTIDSKVLKFDSEVLKFAGLANCAPEQAKEFFRALERVRKITDEQGMPITELLINEWRKIIQEQLIEIPQEYGLVRLDTGDELKDPVAASIDIRSKEYNPTGFIHDRNKEIMKAEFGGINLYFSFDLSGSMISPDPVSGRSKADVQRDAALLFVDSLMQCAYMTRRDLGDAQGDQGTTLPIKVMVTVASQSGEVKLPLTDCWGAKEQWALYTALNQPARGGTPTHTTLKLIEREFLAEKATLKEKQVTADRLPIHYTVEISDGEPDDFNATEEVHRKLKANGMRLRSYVIGKGSRSADAAPPLASFSELPKILADDILKQFKKLHSHKVKT